MPFYHPPSVVDDDDDDDVVLLAQDPSLRASARGAQVSSSASRTVSRSRSVTLDHLTLDDAPVSTPQAQKTTTFTSGSGSSASSESSKKRRFQDEDSPSRGRGFKVSPKKVAVDGNGLQNLPTASIRIDLTEDEIINLVESEEREVAQKLEEEEAMIRDLLRKSSDKYPPRNLPPVLPFIEVERCKWKGSTLIPGKVVELQNRSFLRITSIIENMQTGEALLRGWQMWRVSELNGQIEQNRNELFIQFDVDLDDKRPLETQCVIEVNLSDILRLRRKVIFTNEPYQRYHYDENHVRHMYDKYNDLERLREIARREGYSITYLRENEVLVVRYKAVAVYRDASYRRVHEKEPNRWSCGIIGKRIEVLREHECSPGKYKTSEDLRIGFRGKNHLGGSFQIRSKKENAVKPSPERIPNPNKFPKAGKSVNFIDLEDFEASPKKTAVVAQYQSQKVTQVRGISGNRLFNSASPSPSLKGVNGHTIDYYTYGDSFCGAGGMTRGAYMAKLRILWGMDFNEHAGTTWKKNFPNANMYEMWAHEFVNLPDAERALVVDILHLSPPCQYFSPVHTRPGADDEQNSASLFSVEKIVHKSKPRIATLEETPGLLTIHKEYFNALVCMFTSLGFSISWQILNMEEHGLPQKRHRLIIVASCPGEPLPDFLRSTHSENGVGGLKRYVTPRQVLNKIPRNAKNHEMQPVFGNGKRYATWDDSKVINTITCGTTLSHPSGTRACTDRERGALNGYPVEHVFYGREIRKQIGNSVPPVFAKALLCHINDHLKRVDGIERRKKRSGVAFNARL